jgi:hypothetical protein
LKNKHDRIEHFNDKVICDMVAIFIIALWIFLPAELYKAIKNQKDSTRPTLVTK